MNALLLILLVISRLFFPVPKVIMLLRELIKISDISFRRYVKLLKTTMRKIVTTLIQIAYYYMTTSQFLREFQMYKKAE
jgi:hypothetical protein